MEGWQTQLTASPECELARPLQVTVLLPAYDEECAIQRVLSEIVEALADEPLSFEIVVVDDASTDRTAELAEQFAADCWRCPVRVEASARRAATSS